VAKSIHICGWAILAAILLVSSVQAQDTDADKNDKREQPVAPYAPPLPAGKTSVLAMNLPQGSTEETEVAGNNRPLSGVQEATLGPILGARNFLVPSINVMSQMATSSSVSGYSGPTAFSYVLGTLDLNRVSERSEILLHYTGGAMLSSYLNSAIQDMEFSYNLKGQRWSLLLGEQASYLSESPFGFGGVGGLSFLNGSFQFAPILNGSLAPDQTIPTILAARVSNTAVAQIEYQLSQRSSWTASGSYGLLNFLGAGYINSTEGAFQTGYNYSLSQQSSLAVIYHFDDFRFTYLPESIEGHEVQLGYARYVTGRLSFHVAAGPNLEQFRGQVIGSTNRVSWAMDSALNYKLDRTTLLLSYDRRMTGGSGVLLGAQTSQVQATAERKLTDRWQGSASMGYASNQGLVQTAASLGKQHYDSWYVAVRFNHQLRPGTSFFLSYDARVQAMNAAACGIPSCGTSGVSHEFSAGFNLGLRPILFR
jgi:hypothetical protein